MEKDLQREVQTQEGIRQPREAGNPDPAAASEMPRGEGCAEFRRNEEDGGGERAKSHTIVILPDTGFLLLAIY